MTQLNLHLVEVRRLQESYLTVPCDPYSYASGLTLADTQSYDNALQCHTDDRETHILAAKNSTGDQLHLGATQHKIPQYRGKMVPK